MLCSVLHLQEPGIHIIVIISDVIPSDSFHMVGIGAY